MAKNKPKVVVSFEDSSSTHQVTGSMVKVNNNILIETGGSQGGSLSDNYKHNNSNFSFKVKDIKYVFLLHNHIDHILRCPLLYLRNCDAKVFVPSGNREIMYLSLLNSAMILRGESETLSKNGKDVAPIYTSDDVDKMFEHVYEIDMRVHKVLDEDTSFTFISSGHVPFAASLILEVCGKKIFYTSDMGTDMFESYYTEPQDVYEHGVDVVISECTYSDPKRSTKHADEREKDIERLCSAVDQYDKILIPSFAFARSQQLLTTLHELYKDDQSFDHEIVLDSILLNDITNVYKKKFPEFRKVMAWDKVRQITKKDRLALALKRNKKLIVISASGSLTGGASIFWCKTFLPNPKACCVIVGYTFAGSLGRRIKDGKEDTITIGEDVLENKMQVTCLKSMSSHMQYDGLVKFLTEYVTTPKIVLHHSNQTDKMIFKKVLDKIFAKKCMSTKVVCPDNKTKIRL